MKTLKQLDFLKRLVGVPAPDYEPALLKTCVDKKSPTGKRHYIGFKYYDAESDSLKIKQIRISQSKYPTSAAAKAYAMPIIKQINKMLSEGYHKPDSSSIKYISLSDAIKQYYEYACTAYRSMKDYKNMFGEEGMFTKYSKVFFKDWALQTIERKHVLEMLDYLQRERRWQNTTRNDRMYQMSGMFEFFLERQYIHENPCKGIKKLKQSHAHFRPLVGGQIPLMKDAIQNGHYHLYLFISFMYYTLVRPKELINAKISHLDLNHNKFFIPNSNSKNGSGSYVDIPPKLKEMILDYGIMSYPSDYYIIGKGITEPKEERTSYNRVRDEHAKYFKRYGLEKTHKLYSWRVTGFCEFYRQAKDIKALSKQARHADLKTTDIYLSYYNLYHHKLVDFE